MICEKCGLRYSTLKKCGTCGKKVCSGCSVTSVKMPGRFCTSKGLACFRKAKKVRA